MKKKKKYSWYRHMKTGQERRANGSRKDRELYKWIRAKRSAQNLPNTWDDVQYTNQKTWKVKRLKQYRDNPRGQQHSMSFKASGSYSWRRTEDVWVLYDYLEEHDIPFRFETIKESYIYYSYYYKQEVLGHKTVGYTITWWSDKDIGVNFILKR